MNPYLKRLHTELAALNAEAKAIINATEPTQSQVDRSQVIGGLIKAKQAEIEGSAALADLIPKSEAFLNGGQADAHSVVSQLALADRPYQEDAKSFGNLKRVTARAKYFSMVSGSRAEAQKKAYGFGQFLLAVVKRSESAIKYCKDNGIAIAAAQTEGANDAGGALVTPEFEDDILVLRETFGVIRKYARSTFMSSDTKFRPRRRGGLVAYHVGSQTAAAESRAVWDQIELVAKKVMVLARYESELNEDAIVDFGDTMAGEIAYAFTVCEDSDGFIGDGGSSHGGIVGLTNAFINQYTTGGGVGLILATGGGDHWSGITLKDFTKVKGALPEYTEQMGNIGWYCHKAFFEEVMAPIALSAGGVTAAEVVAGVKRKFMGYEVRISQTMPNSPAAGQVPVTFGAMELSTDFGDRRRTTIAFSDQAAFEEDVIIARGTERYDIVNHDIGTATVAGPMVALVTQ